jgi:serine/threonine protein kinase
MAAAWSRGEQVCAELLLARYPALCDEDAIRLVYEEVCLRREAGQEIETREVVRRFPQWKDELEILLGCDRLLRPFTTVSVFPEPGTQLGPFRLLEELGRGASGRTYLAVEPAMADRLVVLKVIPDDEEEHLHLARMPHTHIIPVFSQHTFAGRGLRALCMPHVGGASLARLLDALVDVRPVERTGHHLLEVLDRAACERAATPPSDGPYRLFLERATYVEAVCWIGICLAKALHHAHQHGLVHMDVKPSNVLLAADARPILLDFHLARGRIKRGEQILDRLGGTPGWMAPEQEAALDSTHRGQPAPGPVDGRADIYALGLLLRAALTGDDAGHEVDVQVLRRFPSAGVSVGLADILARCLAEDPEARYADAAALAEDLCRHLNDLPLRGVPNRSLGERWRKWRRRQPAALARATAWLAVLSAGVVLCWLAVALYTQRVRELETALEDGARLVRDQRFAEAASALARGLVQARSTPFAERLRDELAGGLLRAQRGQQALELRQLAALEFQRVPDERPRDFWSHFYKGSCAYRLRHFEDAVAAFGACIALAPSSPECYYNRAVAAQEIGRDDQAFRDYSRALKLDPRLPAAALNRGILSYKRGRHDEAIADFERALRALPDTQTSGRTYYNLALAYLALGNRSAAVQSAQEAAARGHAAARGLQKRLRRAS